MATTKSSGSAGGPCWILDDEPVELAGLAAEAVETARTVGPSWPLDFVAGAAVEVKGDRGALRQVVDNLLANVRVDTPEGTPARELAGRGRWPTWRSPTRGRGISPDEAAVVFERFFRADPSIALETGGAGLGLAIVSSIVRPRRAGQRGGAPGGRGGSRVTLPALDGAGPDD